MISLPKDLTKFLKIYKQDEYTYIEITAPVKVRLPEDVSLEIQEDKVTIKAVGSWQFRQWWLLVKRVSEVIWDTTTGMLKIKF